MRGAKKSATPKSSGLDRETIRRAVEAIRASRDMTAMACRTASRGEYDDEDRDQMGCATNLLADALQDMNAALKGRDGEGWRGATAQLEQAERGFVRAMETAGQGREEAW